MRYRIIKLRKNLNLTQKDFCKKIGIARSTYSQIENGVCPITERTIISICAKFHVNEDWLRNGQGEIFNSQNKIYDDFFQIFSQLNIPLQDFLINVAKELLKTQNKL